MPRMKSLFRSGNNNNNNNKSNRNLPRDSSARSLSQYADGEATSPEPLLRKCHTVLALSTAGAPQTRLARGKGSKLDFLRRMSPSKSAVFTTTKLPGLPRSPSTLSELRRGRDSSVVGTDGEIVGCSRCASTASVVSRLGQDSVFCKLCLSDVSIREMYQLQQCLCRFCTNCMGSYVAIMIRMGDYNIQCPDANCDCQGELLQEEIQALAGPELYQQHLKFKTNLEVDCDPLRVWCPMPGCESVVQLTSSKHEGAQSASCPSCNAVFCAKCSMAWHPTTACTPHPADTLAVCYDDTIKRCPSCKVPIERDAGCAQMLCKRCKHVFCWYCLTSLDDDFLLRHYDKGPCKNKLGHSRASVLWHRIQVIGIFAGFGLLLVMASPLLLFVGPCLLCSKCKPCTKHDLEDDSLYGL